MKFVPFAIAAVALAVSALTGDAALACAGPFCGPSPEPTPVPEIDALAGVAAVAAVAGVVALVRERMSR
jgi:hypothetical protein